MPLTVRVSPLRLAFRMQPVSPSQLADSQGVGDPLNLPRLVAAARLVTVEHVSEVESTMTQARVLASRPQAALPALVIADRQLRGQGRRGAGWWQAEGSLAMTVILDPAWLGWPAAVERTPAASGWSLACGIALAETLMSVVPGLAVGLRWPNDLEVNGRKLAGILAEASPSGRVLFGVGVNTAGRAADAPPPLRERLVTVPDLVGEPLPRQQLLEAFLPLLWELLRSLAVDSALLYQRYAPLCTLTGTPVTFHHGQEAVQGVCLGIDAAGGLRIQSATGERTFYAGSLTPESSQWRPARNPRS